MTELKRFKVGNREVMDDLGEEREGNIIRASAASVDIEDDYGTVWRFWSYPFRLAAAEIVRSRKGKRTQHSGPVRCPSCGKRAKKIPRNTNVHELVHKLGCSEVA